MAAPRRLSRLAAAVLLALPACNKAPAEPEGRPASSSDQSPAVAPLLWDAPAAWTKLDVSGGPKKAAYQVTKAGDDKEEAQVEVLFFGTGAKGDPVANFKEWFDQFDGNVGATAARETFAVHALKAETVEVSGTYKIALTRPPRGRKAAPVQMVKNKWRLYGAVVRTPDRGNWFFKLVGPDETVQAARSAFRTMVESTR
jgi:hypothetical protein